MAESLVSEWLDENRYRAFPLKEDAQRTSGGFTLDDSVLLDAYFHIETDAPVSLQSVQTTVDTIVVTTSADVFTADLPIPNDGITVTNISGGKITIGVAANTIPVGAYSFTNVFFEDSVCVYYNAPWLGVDSVEFSDLAPLDGDIDLFPRIHTYLNTKDVDVLLWTVNRNQGTPDDNCTVYGNLPDDCGDQVSTINGVTSNNTTKEFKLTSGGGVRVVADKDNNELLIALTFNVDNICPPIPPTT